MSDALPADPVPGVPSRRGLAWWLLIALGSAVLWCQYMFPGAGNVLASGHRYRAGHTDLKLLSSLGVWSTALMVAAGLFMAKNPPRPPHSPENAAPGAAAPRQPVGLPDTSTLRPTAPSR